jgi:hypothetical protein
VDRIEAEKNLTKCNFFVQTHLFHN